MAWSAPTSAVRVTRSRARKPVSATVSGVFRTASSAGRLVAANAGADSAATRRTTRIDRPRARHCAPGGAISRRNATPGSSGSRLTRRYQAAYKRPAASMASWGRERQRHLTDGGSKRRARFDSSGSGSCRESISGGEMGRTYRIAAAAGLVVAIALLAGAFRGGGRWTGFTWSFWPASARRSRARRAPPLSARARSAVARPTSSASRTYPANESRRRLRPAGGGDLRDDRDEGREERRPGGEGHKWKLYGPTRMEPSRACRRSPAPRTTTASRVTALVIVARLRTQRDGPAAASGSACPAAASGAPTTRRRRIRTGSSSKPDQLDQNSVGPLTLDPTDKKNDTLYLGTGEANRCAPAARPASASTGPRTAASSGRSRGRLRQQRDVPVCGPGQDSFLGRGIARS